MTPLRQRMINDMTVRGLARSTMESYLRSVTRLARHYRRSPDRISAREVQDFLVFLQQHVGLLHRATCNTIRHGVRFFYRITLERPDPHIYVPGAKVPSTPPPHDEAQGARGHEPGEGEHGEDGAGRGRGWMLEENDAELSRGGGPVDTGHLNVAATLRAGRRNRTIVTDTRHRRHAGPCVMADAASPSISRPMVRARIELDSAHRRGRLHQ